MSSSPETRARVIGAATLVLFVGSAWYGVWSILPPRPVPATAPEGEFSSGRALRHLQVIAAQPHPVGSAENTAVRHYLVAELERMGFEVDVQETPYLAPMRPSGGDLKIQPVILANIVARLNGRNPGLAVVLACHYDSAPLAPGAGDDGAAVAALIETARAVRAGPALQNDLIILMTDGEEAGLLGAGEFIAHHPWANQIGVIFNYDARGSGGPSILMETSPQDGRLIREFALAAPYPFGAALANVVYQTLPNSTDMSVFRDHNLMGLNFCFDKGLAHYHRPTDTVANLDEATVQHIGANALALARHFGNLDLASLRDEDETYFNPYGMIFLHYPSSWNRPLAIVTIVLVCALSIWLVKREESWVRGIPLGVAAAVLIAFCAIAPVLALSAWMMTWPSYRDALVNGDLPQGDWYLAGFSALALASQTAATSLIRRQLRTARLTVGGLIVWAGLAAAACAAVPAACYQTLWPLAWGSLGAAGAVLFAESGAGSSRKRFAAVGLCWLSTMAIVVQAAPLVFLVGITFGSAKVWMAIVPLALFGLLLCPCWELISQAYRWLSPLVSALAAAIFLAWGR